MLKVLSALIAIFTLSGCCEIFGICTSVAVHTSIDSPRQFAQADVPLAPAQQMALAEAPYQVQTAANSCALDSQ